MLVFLLLDLNVNIRVRIIVSHFANCEVNSSYCGCKVVNHTKIAKQFFSRGKFNSSRLCLSTSYPYFIHSLHTIIKRNIAYTQNYIPNGKNALQFLKNIFACARVKISLRSAYLLQSEFQTMIGTLNIKDVVTFSEHQALTVSGPFQTSMMKLLGK